jgi:ArsR family transcriptional regulator
MNTRAAAAFCADKMKVLSDVTRLFVLEELIKGPKNVTELNARLRIDQSLLSHHLQILRKAGFVRTAREGKTVRYEVSPDTRLGSSANAIHLGCCQISFVRLPRRKPPNG